MNRSSWRAGLGLGSKVAGCIIAIWLTMAPAAAFACLTEGQTCSGTECCSGLYCDDTGSGPICLLATGQTAGSASDCSSDHLVSGACACNSLNGSCYNAADCCSGYTCTGGLRGYDGYWVAGQCLVVPGDSCQGSAANCISDTCSSGTCSCSANGSPCSGSPSGVCCSGMECVNGYCSDPVGTSCSDGEECTSGVCSSSSISCVFNASYGGYVQCDVGCAYETLGDQCGENADCASDTCVLNVCVANATLAGTCDGVYGQGDCNGYDCMCGFHKCLIPAGQNAQGNVDNCTTGLLNGTNCGTSSLGDYCADNADCNSPLVCGFPGSATIDTLTSGNGLITPVCNFICISQVGGTCAADYECTSGNCLGNDTCGTNGLGGTCEYDSDCTTGHCSTGVGGTYTCVS